MSPAAKFMSAVINGYRKFISPLKLPCCRFVPTCSEYALEALRVHGFFKGLALTVWRVLRCNPLCRGGYDPVPAPSHKRAEAVDFKNNH